MVAPAYVADSYVDHTLSANLDSTFAFEGPEKLLEIWFWKSESHLPKHLSNEGLRSIPLEQWVKVLDLVNCKILSMKSSKYMDAYLLSESSLFVFPHKMILKTCGTTTTLACMDKLFEIVRTFYFKGGDFGSAEIYKIFYSRRSFMFPDKQTYIHKDWKNEVNLLNQHFSNGKSYVVGDYNSDDHWYLFIGGEQVHKDESSNDQTFEILMTELDESKAAKFVTSRKPGVESLIQSGVEESDLGHDLGLETMVETNLHSLFSEPGKSTTSHLPSPSLSDNLELDDDCEEISPKEKESFNFIHDAFSFTPCGYSSNSICSNKGGYYYTLHITPESGWSYASFETNYPFGKDSPVSITDVLLKVLGIFEPRKFSMTLINEDFDGNNPNFLRLQSSCNILKDYSYEKQERVVYDLKGEYKLLYLNFKKN
ncbi:S-adenosylmethionine decarboxylase [Suhomyces tanzawaensis NRRL Y-17324]|uniref:adenosylmethionine decarboxylase n=1 Tax=Suhomyces tanzawaensis NRRL Y-17324 TaxID=984487 RepID=A0A1E4SQ24_9ASCO|nr:S-adenosylmethionine decarboxylase [Suhomyces tanzawaensis NRRL Y-17324]ODV81599.1 S-adenosylmethionine decarboxylase [Suhomyces tanzawaensis NRRL Y-17324]